MSSSVISPQFSRIFVASDLEQAVLDSLHTWFPTYLREVERQIGMAEGTNKPPVNYSNRNKFDSLAGEAVPKVVCISPGTIGNPIVSGRSISMTWAVGVGVVMAARSEGLANKQIKIYGAAARAIVLQQFPKAGIAIDIQLLSENYEDLPVRTQNQHARAAGVYFTMNSPDIVRKGGMGIGPLEPDEDPYEYGEVETIFIDLEKEDLNEA
jgi:hypothetical protein